MNQQEPSVTGGPREGDVKCPYPGLRPFKQEESLIFFGRDSQVDQMLELLRRVRFLAVVGSSGCGKSSSVKAGLFPALHAGAMLSSNVPWADAARFPNWVASRWFTVDMRPGAHPFRGLARGLLDSGLLGESWDPEDPGSVPALAARLQAGPRQLLKLWQQAEGSPTGNLLILADQFEELFRFRDGDNFGMAQSFVSSLLEFAAQDDWPIYVAITMRSDFLGECSQFLGLPEVLNKGQFLVPRLTTAEICEAVERPARIFGVELDPLLVTQMLNDIGNDSDQLPLLQHALKRTWDLSAHGNASNGHTSDRKSLILADYHRDEIGGVTQALNRHLKEVFEKLGGHDENDGEKRLARVLFQALALHDNGRNLRRPTKLGVVAQIAGVDEGEVMRIVDIFRDPAGCFLTPPSGTPLTSETMLDISHECLLRQERLKKWLEAETKSALSYRRLVDAVSSGESRLSDAHLAQAQEWLQSAQPNRYWAMRYDGAIKPDDSVFDRCRELIESSEKARQDRWDKERSDADTQQRLLREKAESESERAREAEAAAARFRRRTNFARLAFLLAVVCFFLAMNFLFVAQKSEQVAQKSEQVAIRERHKAENATAVAKAETIEATAQRNRGEWINYSQFLVRARDNWSQKFPTEAWKALDSASDHQDDVSVMGWEWDLCKAEFRGPFRRISVMADSTSGWSEKINAVAWSPDGRRIAVGTFVPDTLPSAKPLAVLFVVEPEGSAGPIPFIDESLKGGIKARPPRGSIRCLTWLDNEKLVSGGDDGRLILWNVTLQTPLPVGQLKKKEKSLPATFCSVASLPDKSAVITGDDLGQVLRWSFDSDDLTPFKLGEHKGSKPDSSGQKVRDVAGLAVHPGGAWVATGGMDGSVRVWALNSGQQQPSKDVGSPVSAVAFSADGNQIAVGCENGLARVWEFDIAEGQIVGKFRPFAKHRAKLRAVAWAGKSPDEDASTPDQWLSTSDDGAVKLYDGVNSRLLLGSRDHVASITLGNGGMEFASSDANDLVIGPLQLQADAKLEQTLPDGEYYSVEISRKGDFLVGGLHNSDKNNYLVAGFWTDGVWKISDQRAQVADRVSGVAIGGPNQRLVASCTTSGVVQLWDYGEKGFSPRATLPRAKDANDGRPLSLALHPSGKYLLCARDNGTIEHWYDLESERPRKTETRWLPLKPNEPTAENYHLKWSKPNGPGVYSMEFDLNGRRLLTGDMAGRVLVWTVSEEGLSDPTWVGWHESSVYCASFSHDGRRILSGDVDGLMRVWIDPEVKPAVRDANPKEKDQSYLEVSRGPLCQPLWEHHDEQGRPIVGAVTFPIDSSHPKTTVRIFGFFETGDIARFSSE